MLGRGLWLALAGLVLVCALSACSSANVGSGVALPVRDSAA